MASKSKRSSARTRDSVISVDTSTNPEESNASGFSPNSSVSSTRWSRQQEKEQLSNLNDRLATYIERVRNLESENSRLHIQIRDVEVVERKDKEDLISRYEVKIEDIRKHLDYMTREKARLEIEKAKAVDGHQDLKARAADLEKKLKSCENDNKNAFNRVQDLTAQLNNANNARQIAENENNAIKKDLDELEKANAILRQQLEDEVVLRTELETKLNTYKEDLEFMRRSHSTQMEEFRRKRQVEMTSFSTEVENKYQTKFQEQLQNMRDDFDKRITQNRAEIDELYKSKLAEAAEAANRNRHMSSEYREEASRYRLRITELEDSLKNHDGKVAALTNRIEELETQLRRLQNDTDFRIRERDERIHALEREAEIMLNDYQDLMDLKVQLDTELQAYQKLLEGEETRLHITPSQSPNISQHHVSFEDQTVGGSSARRGVKRRRISDSFFGFDQLAKNFKSDRHAEGPVIIDDVDVEGKSISLKNTGDKDIVIGGWVVKSTAGDKEVIFKFNSKQVIKSGNCITLWSNNAGKGKPPHNIVMRNQIWPSGDAIRVDLFDNEQKLMAWNECVLQHGFHRIENGSDPDQRCSIM